MKFARSTRTVLWMTTLAAVGCKKVEPAPKALDRLFPYFFTMIDEGSDEDLAYGIRELHKEKSLEEGEDLLDGSISKLNKSDLQVVGLNDRDPSKAAGVFLVNKIECSFSQLEKILYHKHQDQLYDGVYDTYNRAYTSDKDAYINRDTMELTWDLDYEATIVGKTYRSDVKGKLRRVPNLGEDETPHGAFLVTRAYLPRPADFESGNTSLDQDYQIEMYYKLGGGQILHAYGVWREADFGGNLTSDHEGTQRLLLNSMADWDADTEKLCEEGRP